ncbi:MAG: LamG domain-containing protein, partial [Planctomycetota bacterium]
VLRLFFYGDPNNDVNAPLYVGVKDGGNPSKYAEVRYGEYDPNNEDVNDVNEPEWHRWDIGLPHFNDSNYATVANDVDLTNIAELYIGFGDRRNPMCGPEGVVIFDDIRLHMPICRPEFGPALDFSGNCIVDMADVGIMAGAWLRHDVNYSPGQMQEPNDANLVGWWRLDGDTNDSSIWDHNSTIEGSYSWVTGHNDVNVDDLALEFGADGNSRVLVEDNNTTPELRPEHQVSASAWVYFTKSQNSARIVVKGNNDWETYDIEVDGTDQFVFMVRDANGNKYSVPDEDDDDEDGKNIWTDDWIHLAGTYDGNEVKSYVNGELSGSTDANFVAAKGWTLSQDTTGLAIGSQADSLDNQFEGTIDEVRVYDYALSEAEVRWLATDGTGYVPLTSPYDLYDKEAPGNRAINYRDFAVLLEDWLEEILYP